LLRNHAQPDDERTHQEILQERQESLRCACVLGQLGAQLVVYQYAARGMVTWRRGGTGRFLRETRLAKRIVSFIRLAAAMSCLPAFRHRSGRAPSTGCFDSFVASLKTRLPISAGAKIDDKNGS